MIRLAIIGIGGFGQRYVESIGVLGKEGLCSLEAAVVAFPEQDRIELEALKKELPSIRIYSSLPELLAAERALDLVCIPTGIPSHYEYSRLCLEAGLHVLCEKPVAGTYKDALDLAVLRRRSNMTLAVGFQNIYSSSIQRIKKLILDGSLGALLELRGVVSWQRSRGYFRRNGWSGRIHSGEQFVFDSPLQNAAAHVLQNLLYLAGDTPNESAVPGTVYGENYRVNDIESADTQFIQVRTASGACIRMGASLAAGDNSQPSMRILLEEGEIRWTMDGGRTTVFDTQGRVTEEFDNGGENPKITVFRNLFDSIASGTRPLCHIENSISHTLCIRELYRSMPEIRRISSGISEGEDVILPGGADALNCILEEGRGFYEQKLSWAAEGQELEVEA